MIKQDLYKQIAFAAIGSGIKMFVVEEAHIDGTIRLRYTGYADGVGFNFFADEIDVVMV